MNTILTDATDTPQVNTVSRTEQPRAWVFTERRSGQQMTFTCMTGCSLDHAGDIATPTFADDIWCSTRKTDITLPINENGKPEEFRVLGVTFRVQPWDRDLALRLPHACIEFIDDCWIEGLDPDGLATVISTLANRLDTLRAAHAHLIEVRTEYQDRT